MEKLWFKLLGSVPHRPVKSPTNHSFRLVIRNTLHNLGHDQKRQSYRLWTRLRPPWLHSDALDAHQTWSLLKTRKSWKRSLKTVRFHWVETWRCLLRSLCRYWPQRRKSRLFTQVLVAMFCLWQSCWMEVLLLQNIKSSLFKNADKIRSGGLGLSWCVRRIKRKNMDDPYWSSQTFPNIRNVRGNGKAKAERKSFSLISLCSFYFLILNLLIKVKTINKWLWWAYFHYLSQAAQSFPRCIDARAQS